MSEKLTIDFSKPVPLFPLANTVLLPHATIPLHIFEPRYRRMIADVLETNSLIAMATLAAGNGASGLPAEEEADPDLGNDAEAPPPLRRHVCVGYVLKHEAFSDGRYNILLQGVVRAKIRREIISPHHHRPYRLALLAPTEPRAAMEIDLDAHRKRIVELLEDPLLDELSSVKSLRNWLSGDVPTSVLIDLSILALAGRSGERYTMLAQPDAEARARWLEHHLADTRRTLHIADHFGPSRTEEGVNLN